MKDKVISMIIGIVIWWILMFGYFELFVSENSSPAKSQMSEQKPAWWEISDEQLEKMAERSWLSTSEIKERIDSWETMRDIMWGQWWTRKQ